MNLYEPYIAEEKEDAMLYLKLSYQDRILSVIVSRILPLLILMMLFLSFILRDVTIPGWILAGSLFIILSFTIILHAKTGMEIYFKETEIEIYTLRYNGKKKESILLKDVDYINLEIFNEPRISGAYYRLVLKNGKQILLLKMPEFLNYEKKRFRSLNQQLEFLTMKAVKGDLERIA